MPHFQLASRALYRVSKLPDALAALGLDNNASGYAELERDIRTNHTVSGRSIQLMLYQGQYLKHRKCAAIRDNVSNFASKNGVALPILDGDFIDEHEWYISRLQHLAQQASVLLKRSLPDVVKEIAAASNTTPEFISEMMKYKRCLKGEAKAVQNALVALAPESFVIAESPEKSLGRVIVKVAREPVEGREPAPIAWVVRRGPSEGS